MTTDQLMKLQISAGAAYDNAVRSLCCMERGQQIYYAEAARQSIIAAAKHCGLKVIEDADAL